MHMITPVEIAIGSRVSVNFMSESRTSFSETHFQGEGEVDLFDNLYVMGRLDSGLSFMCGYADLIVLDLAPEKPTEDGNAVTIHKVIEFIEGASSEQLESIQYALDTQSHNFGVILDEPCGCDLEAEAEEARKLTLINLIERINQFGLKEGLDELSRDGFLLGAHLIPIKLES